MKTEESSERLNPKIVELIHDTPDMDGVHVMKIS